MNRQMPVKYYLPTTKLAGCKNERNLNNGVSALMLPLYPPMISKYIYIDYQILANTLLLKLK